MIYFGIIGAGNIAHRFAKALAGENGAELYAISGRDRQKLQNFGEKYAVKEIFLDYRQMIECKKVDAIYIALPHHLHKEWAVRALKAGKAVLVEKPAAMSKAEMLEIAKTARDASVLFMEAQKGRFVPLYSEFKRRLNTGEFGKVISVETSLCNEEPLDALGEPHTYHYQAGVGGAILDCGTYCASLLEDLTKGECRAGKTEAVFQYGVDVYTRCDFTIGETRVMFETAFDRAKPRNAKIITERGEIRIEELHRSTKMVVSMKGEETYQVEIPYEQDDFYSQIHHFVMLLQEGRTESPVMPIEGSVRIAEILDFVADEAKKFGQVGAK